MSENINNAVAKLNIEDVVISLDEYYERLGFGNFYERVLKNMSEENLRKSFVGTFFYIDEDLVKVNSSYMSDKMLDSLKSSLDLKEYKES